jgi:cyclophilin family peptidyl-prolyl cis-trans isomerase
MRIEATTAIGNVGGDGVNDLLLDLIADRNPLVRGAAIRSFGHLAPEAFVAILSGLDADPHWSARAALATTLGDLPESVGLTRLKTMVNDEDQRVIPAVLSALAHARPDDAAPILLAQLKAVDPVVRAAAAAAIAEVKPSQGPAALREAYQLGDSDLTYLARGAAIAAMAAYGKTEAVPLLTQALSDPEWAVRVRALELLRSLDAEGDAAAAIRPAPMPHGIERYDLPRLIAPPVSTAAYLDTDKGTIQIELAVLDAPLTVENFVALARSGFYEGITFHRVVPNFVVQAGDPRGDGEGGPGFTIRDELNERSYGRGTVGMALDWADTGGSQFFITHSPQPHLDARYTVFGRVVEGMDVVDRLQPGDVLRHVRIWDGVER